MGWLGDYFNTASERYGQDLLTMTHDESNNSPSFGTMTNCPQSIRETHIHRIVAYNAQ
jgi:hypothetical protein